MTTGWLEAPVLHTPGLLPPPEGPPQAAPPRAIPAPSLPRALPCQRRSDPRRFHAQHGPPRELLAQLDELKHIYEESVRREEAAEDARCAAFMAVVATARAAAASARAPPREPLAA